MLLVMMPIRLALTFSNKSIARLTPEARLRPSSTTNSVASTATLKLPRR
jgi:hypothetical protein